jgi:ABC-type Fe3+ transport system permease subunit
MNPSQAIARIAVLLLIIAAVIVFETVFLRRLRRLNRERHQADGTSPAPRDARFYILIGVVILIVVVGVGALNIGR